MYKAQVHSLNKEKFATFLADEGINDDQQITFIAPLTAYDLAKQLEAAYHGTEPEEGLVAIVW